MSWGEINDDPGATFGEAREFVEVLLVYEDFSTGLRARQALERLARDQQQQLDFNVDLWKLDLLREPALLKQAALNAAKADMVFLSAHGQPELPQPTSAWLEHWLERCGGDPCALVVLLDALPEVPRNQTWEKLRTKALNAGVDLFLHAAEDDQIDRRWAEDQFPHHHETRAALPDPILDRVEPYAYRHWGLNE